MIHRPDNERGQGMVEYLLIMSMVILTIMALFAGLMHFFS
jgi:Tfp pilus assembly protein FimT